MKTTYRLYALSLFMVALFVLAGSASAADKVVVIPLNTKTPPPEPFAPVTSVSPPNSVYTVVADTVLDKVTGLMWQKSDDNIRRNWNDAMAYCWDLVLPAGGFTDWRLPGKDELVSIVDYGTYDPAINGSAFPGTNPSSYWSATPNAFHSGIAWSVNFSKGQVDNRWSSNYYVRCVRRGQ
jgi:hypothetical protein